MPLDDIKRVLGSIGSDDLPRLLAAHEQRIAAQIDEQRRSLAYLRQLIEYANQGNDFPPGEIEMEEFEAQQIISRRERRTLDDVGVFTGETLGQLFERAQHASIAPAGPPFAIYSLVSEEDGFDVEVGLPLQSPAESSPPLNARRLHGGRHAVLTHVGPYETLGAAYRSLGGWLARNDLQPDGPPREIYLTSPAPGLDPAKYRTRLAWPVKANVSDENEAQTIRRKIETWTPHTMSSLS